MIGRRFWCHGCQLAYALALLPIAGSVGGCIRGRHVDLRDLRVRAEGEWRTRIDAASAQAQAPVLAWWRELNDPVLAELAQQALRANIDLEIARQRIVEARARRGVVNADRLPTVDLDAQYLRAGSGENGLAFAAPRPGEETNLFAAGVVAGWEIDLWGRVGRLVDAADDDTRAFVEDYRNAAVSLISELALAYVDLRTLQRRAALVEENVRIQQQTLRLAQTRYQAGTGPELEVAQARALLHSTQARLPELRRAQAVAENRIAILLGRKPADGLIPPGDLPVAALPEDMGLPADLITRRPDIRQAIWRYRAALARSDAAEAERLPRLTLNGTFRLSSNEVGRLFDDAFVYSFGPQLTFPLFEGFRITANVHVHESQAEQARLALEQLLLRAVEEVDNAAIGYVRRRDQVDKLMDAEQAARRSAALAEQLYRSGLRDLSDWLDAQRELVAVQDQLAVARQEVLAETIRLYRALGGGWEVVRLDGSVAARDDDTPAAATSSAGPERAQ